MEANTMRADIRAKVMAGEYLGKDGAIELQRALYLENLVKELLNWAIVLYSAREETDVLGDFDPIVEPLINRIARAFDARNADALDVISTHLRWWAKTEKLDHVHYRAGQAAFEACRLGLEVSEREASGGHNRALLALTYAGMLREGGHSIIDVKYWIREAARLAPMIVDPDQKVRVYKRLTIAYLKLLWPIHALRAARAAFQVKGAADDTKAKLSPL